MKWLNALFAGLTRRISYGDRGGVTFMREQAKANRKGAVKGFPDLIVLPWSNIGALVIATVKTSAPK